MADRATQLEACKAAASNYRSQLDTAATKDEALTLAISAAENLMKALKLTSNQDERKLLKAQCGEIMSVADRIKKTGTWTRSAKQQSNDSKSHHIGQWATQVAVAADSSSTFQDTTTQSSSSRHGLFSASTSDASYQNSPNIKPSNAYDVDSASSPSLKSCSQPYPASTLSHSTLPNASEGSPSRAAASHSQIYRLREPVSSRQLSKREEIILLRASMLSGFKFPPWTKEPSADEFASRHGDGDFIDMGHLSLSPYQQQFFLDWLRAKEAVPPPSISANNTDGVGPLMSSSKPLDLVQDAASDCSVVTSLCAGIARYERGHEQILTNKLYPFDKQRGNPVSSANGKYVVRLNFNGCWRKVVIDDRLPVSKTHRVLHVIDRRNPALLWPALLEKAYLKVRGGYDFPGSNSCGDLWALTGWIPEQVFLQKTDTVPDQLWKRIYNAFMYGDVLVTAGTGKMSTKQEREFGLEGQHSYVILDMKEMDHDRLLLVKNPWIEGKGWRGPRPSAVAAMDDSTAGEPSTSVEVYHRDSVPTQDRPHPTTFWIGLEQVIQHFESLYLNWNPGLFRYRQDIHFEWDVNASTPAGCIVNNPQFAFTSKGAGPVWLLLSRHFRDAQDTTKEDSDVFNDGSVRHDTQFGGSGEEPKGYMSIYICTGHGERIYIKDTYLESSDYVTTPQCLLRSDMDASTTYTVVIDQDDLPRSKYTFSLSAFANTPMTLEPATQRLPLQEIQPGAWTRQTAGGSTDSPNYFDNPQYSLHVRERGSLAILLTSTNHEHPLHVKLAFGHGKRLYRLQSRDVLADSGNHRSGCVFAQIKDVQPGYYVIICSLFEAGLTGDYTLRVDSSSQVGLTPIARDGAGLLSMKLAPACFGAHVHKVAAPLRLHRLASYTIIARFLKATSPRAMDLGKLARSPLRLSVELGRGPERRIIIASEQGEYADSATVRSESVDIDPMDCRQGDVWLVLDRLSGPSGPVEEWYDVEMYVNTPQACEVGVWRDWDD